MTERIERLQSALRQRRAILVGELADAEKHHDSLVRRAKRFDPHAAPDAIARQVKRIEDKRAELAEHDRQAVQKLQLRTDEVPR